VLVQSHFLVVVSLKMPEDTKRHHAAAARVVQYHEHYPPSTILAFSHILEVLCQSAHNIHPRHQQRKKEKVQHQPLAANSAHEEMGVVQ
jgi:hypothetical protein